MATYYFVDGYQPPQGVADRSGVKNIQAQLNALGAGLKLDGIWGPKTQAAYQQYSPGNYSSGAGSYQQQQVNLLGNYMQQLQRLLGTSQVEYTPRSTAELQEEISDYLRPSYDRAIAQRREATQTNRAELDADAYARGMGASTYLTDVKARAMDAQEEDIARLENEYAAALAQLVYKAADTERERALAAAQYNAAQQAQTAQLALGLSQDLYGEYRDYLSQVSAAAQSKGGGRGRSGGKARTASEETVKTFLSMLSPEERAAIYSGSTEMGQIYREEIMESLGADGYLAMQGQYPA